MKITTGSRQSGAALVLWPIILVFVVFLIVIGIIVVLMVRTIQKIVPPPPADTRLAIGQPYDGGTVVGWGVPTNTAAPLAKTKTAAQTGQPQTVDIYAGDTPWSVTNRIWSGLLADMQTNVNGLPVEQWTNGMPPMRFYRFNYNP